MTCLLWVGRVVITLVVFLQERFYVFVGPLRTFEDPTLEIIVETPIVWDWIAALAYLIAAPLDVVAWRTSNARRRRRLLMASLAGTLVYLLASIRHGLNPGSFALTDGVAERAFPGIGVGFVGMINGTWVEWPFVRQLRLDVFFNMNLAGGIVGALSSLVGLRSADSMRMSLRGLLGLMFGVAVALGAWTIYRL